MRKCDFCTKSDDKGNCYYTLQGNREEHCEKAINLMCKILQGFEELIFSRDRRVEERGDK